MKYIYRLVFLVILFAFITACNQTEMGRDKDVDQLGQSHPLSYPNKVNYQEDQREDRIPVNPGREQNIFEEERELTEDRIPVNPGGEQNNLKEDEELTSRPKEINQKGNQDYLERIVELTNQERELDGLPPLEVDTSLEEVARAKAKDMQEQNYFSHTSPTYGSPFDMLKEFGVSYTKASENIAKGQTTPSVVIDAWMKSDGHRRNIMDPEMTHIGVGYDTNGDYWTQVFIRK